MKKVMKKVLAALLSVCLTVLAAGCGIDPGTGSKTSADNDKATKSTDSAPGCETKIESREETDSKATEKPVYTIADEVIVDNEKCLLKIVKAEDDSLWGFTLKAYCENKLSDKKLMFSISDAVVNGYQMVPFWAKEVAPGKAANSDITFSDRDFETAGITTADEIFFTLRIYDSDNWMADDIVNEAYTIYPTGLTKEQVQYPDRMTTGGEYIAVDNESCSFIILGSKKDSIWGYTLVCYLENKTDKSLMFSWDDVSVNKLMIDPFFGKELLPGARAYGEVNFMSSKLEENNITKVEKIGFTLRIHDSKDYFADDIFKSTFNLSVK